jgi:LysM repeat protein
MGIFGKSLEEKAQDAIAEIGRLGLEVEHLGVTLDGKTARLTGQAQTMEVKARVMKEFNARIELDNVINTIRVVEAPAKQAAAAPAVVEAPPPQEARVHVVVPGDTLGALAKHYYGKASLYMKIFEANTDILKDPNMIKVGQKLRIPE